MTLNKVLPPPQSGIRLKTLSETDWDYPQVCAQLNGNKSLSTSTLQERIKTPCVQSLQEREMTPFVQSLQEREKTPCVQSLQEREKTPCVQSQSVFIPDRRFKLSSQELEVVLVGGRLGHFLPEWEKQKAHQSILSDPGLIQTAIQGTSKTIQVSLHQQRLRRFRQTKCLVDLYTRPAAERRYQSRAYQKQSRVLQPTVPGPKTRQPLEASHRPQLSKQIPGRTQIQDGIPRVNTCLPQERRMGYNHRSDRRLSTCPYSYPFAKVPQVLPQRSHLPIYQSSVRPSHGPIGVHKP